MSWAFFCLKFSMMDSKRQKKMISFLIVLSVSYMCYSSFYLLRNWNMKKIFLNYFYVFWYMCY